VSKHIKFLIIGLIAGLLLGQAFSVLADQPIKLIINGAEITANPAPQMFSGRVFVPARYVAEPLGATVEWDSVNNAVIIKSGNAAVPETETLPAAVNLSEAVLTTSDGIEVKLFDCKRYDTSFKWEHRNEPNISPVISTYDGRHFFVISGSIENNTSKYVHLDVFRVLLNIVPEVDDGRDFTSLYLDIDYAQTSESRYLPPGTLLKLNWVYPLPADVNVKELFVRGSNLRAGTDLRILVDEASD